jgi:hypothetical protein
VPAPGGKAKVDAEQYAAKMETVGDYKAGAEGKVRVTVDAKKPYHINDKYPYKLKVPSPAPDGISYPKAIVAREDGKFDERQGSFELPFVAAKAGTVNVSATLFLSVCSEANCVMEKQELSLDVDVK